jgi:hypothetical protein
MGSAVENPRCLIFVTLMVFGTRLLPRDWMAGAEITNSEIGSAHPGGVRFQCNGCGAGAVPRSNELRILPGLSSTHRSPDDMKSKADVLRSDG